MNKKALLGFTIVLLVTVILAGLTMYKIAEMLGLHKTEQGLQSFKDLASMISTVGSSPDGTRNQLAMRIDEKSAIVGFAQGSSQVNIYTGINHYDQRPSGCVSGNACICLCRDYDWDIKFKNYGTEIWGTLCKGVWTCHTFQNNIDFPRKLTKEQYGLSYDVEGGFFIGRNSVLGKQDASRIEAVYVENAGSVVGVLFNPDGVPDDVKEYNEKYHEAKELYLLGYTAFNNEDWDTSIVKFNDLISSGLVDYTEEVDYDRTYWWLGVAYRNKKDYPNALKALNEALDKVKDSSFKAPIEEDIKEIKAIQAAGEAVS